MEVDREPEGELTGLVLPLKRKKTVTWAEDDELELALGPPGGAEGAAASAAAVPVVVLPCDGLYDALTVDLLEQQEELPAAAGEEPLSRRQLLERRLAHTDQLASLYEAELWALGEELRLRHGQFVAQRGEQAVWKGGEAHGAGTAADSERQQQQTDGDTEMVDVPADDQAAAAQRQQQPQPLQEQQQAGSAAKHAAAAGEEPAAPGAGLRALWEERQRQQQGSEAEAEQEEQQQGGEQDVKQPQQGAGRQQAEGDKGKPSKKGDKPAAGEKLPGKRGGQAASKDTGGKAGKAESKSASAKDKQPAGAEGSGKQAPKQAAGGKQASPKAAPAGDSASGQQTAAAAAADPGQQGGAAAVVPAEGVEAPALLPPLPPQPRFEDIEALLLSGAAAGLPPVDEAELVEARARFVRRLDLLGRLEQSALSAAARQLDALGGLALLCGRRCRYIMRRSAVAIGRSSGSQGKVDVDLAHEGGAATRRVSRYQAQLWLEPDGGFRLRCVGRRPMWVNGKRLEQGQAAALPTLSHVAVGGVSLLFVANVAAAQRGVARAAALLAP